MLVLWSDPCIFPPYTAWHHYPIHKNWVKGLPCSGTLSYWSAKPQDSHRVSEINHLSSTAEATWTRQTPGLSQRTKQNPGLAWAMAWRAQQLLDDFLLSVSSVFSFGLMAAASQKKVSVSSACGPAARSQLLHDSNWYSLVLASISWIYPRYIGRQS